MKDVILGVKKRRSRCDFGVLCWYVLEIFVCFFVFMVGGIVGCLFFLDDGCCRLGGIVLMFVVV